MNTWIDWSFQTFSRILFALPPFVRHALGDAIGILWFDVFRIRRQIVIDNIKKAFPHYTHKQLVEIGRANLRFLGRELFDYCDLAIMTKERAEKRFVMHGFENVEKAKQQGKGVCLLTLHLGSGDWVIGAMSALGNPMYLVAKHMSAGWLNQLLLRTRERQGTVFIPPRNSAYAILKALKKQGLVIFVQDQFMGPPIGCRNLFFGHETGTALGLAVMAHRSKAPVVPVYTYVDTDDKIHAFFGEEIPYDVPESDPKHLEKMTQKYSNVLESYILRHPTQWMWIHRRWKKFND